MGAITPMSVPQRKTMDTGALKKFAQEARRTLRDQVSAKLVQVLAENSAARREAPKAVQQLESESKEDSEAREREGRMRDIISSLAAEPSPSPSPPLAAPKSKSKPKSKPAPAPDSAIEVVVMPMPEPPQEFPEPEQSVNDTNGSSAMLSSSVKDSSE